MLATMQLCLYGMAKLWFQACNGGCRQNTRDSVFG